MAAILHTEKLCKSFSNGGIQQHVIKNPDIEITEKDFTVIMGASGSGKSTLLYALSGMDTPTLGNVFFGDTDISKYTNDQLAVFRRENCGFVFQSIVMLTHDLRTALRGSRIIYLRDGAVIGEHKMPRYGTNDVKKRQESLQAFLDEMVW